MLYKDMSRGDRARERGHLRSRPQEGQPHLHRQSPEDAEQAAGQRSFALPWEQHTSAQLLRRGADPRRGRPESAGSFRSPSGRAHSSTRQTRALAGNGTVKKMGEGASGPRREAEAVPSPAAGRLPEGTWHRAGRSPHCSSRVKSWSPRWTTHTRDWLHTFY